MREHLLGCFSGELRFTTPRAFDETMAGAQPLSGDGWNWMCNTLIIGVYGWI